MVCGLLGWRFEFDGVECRCLIQYVLVSFISGLDVVRCGLLLPGMMGRSGPFPFFVVLLLDFFVGSVCGCVGTDKEC